MCIGIDCYSFINAQFVKNANLMNVFYSTVCFFFFVSATQKNNDISPAVFATFRSISHMYRVN